MLISPLEPALPEQLRCGIRSGCAERRSDECDDARTPGDSRERDTRRMGATDRGYTSHAAPEPIWPVAWSPAWPSGPRARTDNLRAPTTGLRQQVWRKYSALYAPCSGVAFRSLN